MHSHCDAWASSPCCAAAASQAGSRQCACSCSSGSLPTSLLNSACLLPDLGACMARAANNCTYSPYLTVAVCPSVSLPACLLQGLGACVATAAKANKAKTAGVAIVGLPEGMQVGAASGGSAL